MIKKKENEDILEGIEENPQSVITTKQHLTLARPESQYFRCIQVT